MNVNEKAANPEAVEEYYFLSIKLGLMKPYDLCAQLEQGLFSRVLTKEERNLIAIDVVSRFYEFSTMKSRNLMTLYESMVIEYETDSYYKCVCDCIIEEFRLRDAKLGIR